MRLALAAEYRDDNTGQHTHRVGLLSAQLASAVGLDDEQVDLIKVAARLHDVGKIGISDQILLKAGKLDADEYNRMKAHTTIGAQILSGGRSPILRLAEEIALNHHERWDGNGYPRVLSAEDIPLVGRIVAVADVYDALVSERPYKRAWTQEEAIVEVERQSGLMFDPRLANALRGVLANESGRLNDDKGAPTESPATPPAPVRSPRQPDTHREQAIYASLDATLEKAWAERTSDLSACRQATERALAVAVAHAYRRGVGLARRNLGYCHYLASEYERAIDELLDGLDIGRELGDHVLTRDCLNWLGAVHTSLGDYGAAIEYVERTLELSRNALDEAGVASCITNLGLLHHYLGHDEEAVRYHEESVAISRQAGEVHRQAAALNNLGITLTALGRHGEAVSTFEQALPLAEGTGDRDLRARLLVNLGEAQAAAGDPGLALTTNESALELIRACGNREVEGHALLNTGVIRLSAGDGKGALDPLERALAYATTSGYRTLAYQAHQHLASALRMSGDLDGAFAHLERYHALEREVRDEEADRRLRAFSTQREIERARSEAEIHRLRNVELARALASLQEADRLKGELLKELRAKSSELERQFTVDPLTGVLNRAFFQARLLVEVERAQENRQPIAAAIIDIDNLKGINDGYSHTVGDSVLLEVAAIIRANCRDSDVVARYGGSQFVVALPGTSDSRAVTVCERIRSAIERHDWQRLHPALSVTASVGLAEGPLDGDHERLLNSADARLASAKQQGPNRLAC